MLSPLPAPPSLPKSPPSRPVRPRIFLSSLNAASRPSSAGASFWIVSELSWIKPIRSLKNSSALSMPGISPKASRKALQTCLRISGSSSTSVRITPGRAEIRPLIRAVDALSRGGSRVSTMPGSSRSMMGAASVISAPMPSRPLMIAGMTFLPKVLADSIRLSTQRSKSSPPSTRLVMVLLHAAFSALKEPLIVSLASLLVVPVMPSSVWIT